MTFLIIAISVSAGFVLGSWLKAQAFESQDWEVLRWDDTCFGYRKVPEGRKIYKGEKVYLALEIDTSKIEKNGTPII